MRINKNLTNQQLLKLYIWHCFFFPPFILIDSPGLAVKGLVWPRFNFLPAIEHLFIIPNKINIGILLKVRKMLKQNNGENGQIPPFHKICSKKTFVLVLNGDLPLFLVLEFTRLEFLFSIPSWHWLTWHLGIKKCHFVLEFLGLEYCIVWYLSPLNSGINLYCK